MCILISITLGVALLYTVNVLWRQHQATRRLHNALLKKQPYLREAESTLDHSDWNHLCHAANELIEEVNRLPPKDQKAVIYYIDALLAKQQASS